MTFGKKLAVGFAVSVALTTLTGAIGVVALQSLVGRYEDLHAGGVQNLIGAQKLHAAVQGKSAASRGYLLTKEERFLEESRSEAARFASTMVRLRAQIRSEEHARFLDRIERAAGEHQRALDAAVAKRRADPTAEAAVRLFDDEVAPKKTALDSEVDAFVEREEKLLGDARRATESTSSSAITLLAVVTGAAAIFALLVGAFLTKGLTRQIGSTVQHVQSSSAELQAAANQQAAAAKEQATAMSEIATTISELLATSRQIAESAQRVSGMAEQTATSARAGGTSVEKAQEAMAGIKRQVDAVVGHMLELGRKAQQVGGILEIINELSEQTNILSINATIEAAGAGESGKRFSVVAEEIRRLADRVGASTKEIRTLIEETRAAVNSTVMATETSAKAVDAGARQFTETADTFRQIVDLVRTSSEAAKEIGLSTKQQTTAVEQVNVAIADVAQTTKETETSSSQTLQTASQLNGLSRELISFVQPQGSA